ncbi:EI24 domain-containing protein [Abortiporus biennis]
MSDSPNAVQIPGEFGSESPKSHSELSAILPPELRASTTRLNFPPSYVVVGVYRLFTDKSLYIPAWKKCEHGFVRGATIGLVWAVTTFKIQRKFVELFLIKSPSVTGLSRDAIFGFQVPFDLPTYATLVFLSTQFSAILTFFLSHNIRIARDRVYEQTIQSRGKGPDFWKPYVEEWDNPPVVSQGHFGVGVFASSFVGRTLIKIMVTPFRLVPIVGILLSAWLKALGTARYLHRHYFQAKGMTKEQISIFIEERKWSYRAFGFAAALLEGLPIVGLLFTVSNRIGAAMWAHDLEKHQHYISELKAKKE